MTREARPERPARNTPGKPSWRRHRWRWVLAGAAGLVVLVIVAAGAFIKLQPTLAPLALPTGGASAPAGPLDGTWHVEAVPRLRPQGRNGAAGRGIDPRRLLRLGHQATRRIRLVRLTRQPGGGGIPADPDPDVSDMAPAGGPVRPAALPGHDHLTRYRARKADRRCYSRRRRSRVRADGCPDAAPDWLLPADS
jgi:hypothetical protein